MIKAAEDTVFRPVWKNMHYARPECHVDKTKFMSNHLAVAASSVGGPSPFPTMTFTPALGTPPTTT